MEQQETEGERTSEGSDDDGSDGDDGAGGASATGSDAAEDEDLRDFRPKVTTRPAKDVTERDFFSRQSWADAGCSKPVEESLRAMGFGRPSHIQALAFKDLTGAPPAAGSATILCDAAGSGKTLAYLAPLIQLLKAAEEGGAGRAKPRRPRAVVLAPTAELCTQVHGVSRQISASGGGVKFRSTLVTGGHRLRAQADVLNEGTDLLIGTPGRVNQLLEAKSLDLSEVQFLVLDECDVLLGKPFDMMDDVGPVKAGAGAAGARVVLVTATIPEQAVEDAQAEFAKLRFVAGPNLHRPAAGVEERLIDCSGGTISAEAAFKRKTEALTRLVGAMPSKKTVVFCNKIETCRKLENVLKRLDRRGSRYEVFPYHAAVDDDRREEALARFTKRGDLGYNGERVGTILVSTDRASRGLDSVGVEHVILFDFPRDVSEYVRRVGRTARGANGTGLVSSLVVISFGGLRGVLRARPWALSQGRQVAVAQEIMARNARGAPVERLPEDAAFGFGSGPSSSGGGY